MIGDLTFTVAVDYTDRTRTPEGFRVWRRLVDVFAGTESEATLVAAQLVAAIRDETIDGMVTATSVVGCIA